MPRERPQVSWRLVRADGGAPEGVGRAGVETLLASGEPFGLDVGHPEADELAVAVGEVAFPRLRRSI